MICIILRNIDTEGTDYDLLLYVYLKVSNIHTFRTTFFAELCRLQVVCGISHLVS